MLAYLSRYTHRVAISNRRLIAADHTGVTFRWKNYRIEGPGRYQTMTLSTHEFIRRFLMHVMPEARAARGLPPHPALRTAGQWQPRRQHRAGARAARRAGPLRTAGYLRGPSGRRTLHVDATMPLLRRAHAHHRDLRARQRAKAPTHARAGRDQNRHLMMPSSLIQHRTEARHSGRLSPGQHTGLRRSARLARDRTENPVEQRAIRLFAPARPPSIPAKAIRSPASAQLPQH